MIQLGCGIDSRFPLNTRSVSSPQGSSFITTPRQIATKNAIINIQNLNDEMCSIPFWPLLTQLTTKEIRE